MAPQGHCRRHTSGRLSSAAAMLAVALLVLGPLVHSARARKPEPERPAPGAGVVAWIPVHLGPPPDRPAPGQQQTGPVVAEHTGAAAPIPAGAGVAPQEVAPSGLPNLRYYNAPNGSYYVTPWENLHWGDAVTVYWGVCNIGAADIPNGTRFDWRFYLSTDNYISTGDYAWCNLYRTVGLQAWYYIAGDFTHTLPPSPPPGFPADGIVYIGMFIDYNEAIAESNEEDNRNQGLFKDYDYVTMGAAGEPIIRVEPASLTFTATVGLGPSSAASPAVPVASAAQDEGAIAVTLPDAGGFTVRDTPQGQVIEAPGFATSAPPGEPLLPVATLRLLVPPDIDWRSLRLSLTGGRWVDVPGTYDLAPAPPLASDGPGGPVVDWGGKDPSVIREGRDTRAYGLRAFTPASPLLIASRGGYRQWRIVTVEYRPFSYNPPEKRLRRLEGGRAELSFGRQGAGGQPGGGANVALPLQQKFWERLRPGLANADAVSLYYPQAAPSSTAPLEPGPAANDYVIITTASIQQNSARLADFVQAKEAGGHTVKIVVEGAAEDATHYLSGGSAAQRANNIRTWLANHYLAEGIDYVLLIGDPNPAAHSSTSVPMKMCYPRRGAGSYEESPTDMFYSDLTGSWDPDGDGYYGEYSEVGVVGGIDRLAEVSVGRIPFYGDYDELDGILLKLAAYGQASGDLAWRQKLLVAAAISNHGPQDNNGDGDATDSGDYPASWRTFGDTWGEALKSVAGANGFGTYSLYERQGVYSDGSAYPLTPCDAGLTRDNLVSAWQGHFGFVDWWGHGSYTGAYRRIWSTDSAPPNPGDHLTQHPAETQDAAFFESTDAPLLSDDYPAFVVQVSCDNGTPEYELNLGYRLLEHGAVGTVSSSRVSWYSLGTWSPGSGDGVADNASFGYHIFKRMVQGDQTVGQALAACRGTLSLSSANALWMNCTDFNLYGDPALGLSTSGSGQGLNVFNDGTAYLSVTSITEQSGSDWLSVLPPEPYPFTVAPGGSRRVLVTVNPEGLAAGTYTDRLLLASDDADMSPYPGGVTVTLNVLAGLSPDLVASTPVPSVLPPFHEGQTVEWAVTVTNQGEAGAAATRVGYYLGSSCPDLGRLLADDATEALAPGASDGSQVTCEFQPGDAGERYLVAVADHLNEEPGEGDEENNCACYGPFEVLATYSLYTSTTPAGAGSVAATPPPNASGGRYISGTVVQLDAGAATGYAFDHWSGAASGTSNPTTVTMDAHKVVTATFCALPATPALLSPADGNTTADTTPTFTWQAAAGATDYRVQVDPDPDFPAPIVDETAEATSYTPASALALGTYFWRVRGESSCGSGGWSVVRSLTISATACSDPYEPNDAPAQATPISYGQTLAGAEICPAGDVDVYAFTGAAGERIIASVSAGGPALDSYLRLLAPDGVTLLAEDDGTGSDAEISFALTASGTHYLVVEDRAGAGGPDYGYSLSLVREARKLYLPLCLRP